MPELNKYLMYNGLENHLKDTKNDRVKVIARHWLLQMNPEESDPMLQRSRESDSVDDEDDSPPPPQQWKRKRQR